MYESHWRLKRKPFENCSDPRFYFPGESHQAALLKLRYAVENHRGGAILAGPSGTGKTLLVNMLRTVLDPRCAPVVHLVFPQMPTDQLLAYAACELTGEAATQATEVHQTIRRIEQFLAANTQRGQHAVLVVDEAHLLEEASTWEALRLLMNFESGGQPGLTLVISGQPAILPILDRIPQLDERLGVKCLLRPFTQAETAEYVIHRLKSAGGDPTIFEPTALAEIHRLAQGVPRRINRLCDLALLIGYAEQRTTLSADQLESIHDELVAVVPE
jgi:type II secretory pathway predicted ATPase ExeA